MVRTSTLLAGARWTGKGGDGGFGGFLVQIGGTNTEKSQDHGSNEGFLDAAKIEG